MNLEEKRALSDYICSEVAEGRTITAIGNALGYTSGMIVRLATFDEEGRQNYARARDAAAEVLEAEIIELARNTTNKNSGADRLKIDTFKWIAARRAPKRYSERIVQDHQSSDGSMTPKEPAALDASKLSQEVLDALMAARSKPE